MTGKSRSLRNEAKKARCYLDTEEQRFWIDEAVLPAIREVYGSDILQHHPRSFAEASGRSRARQKESVTTADRSFSELGYFLPNEYVGQDDRSGRSLSPGAGQLERLWEAIQVRLRTDATWRDAQLVTITYNCKLQYRDRSLAVLQTRVERSLDMKFDRSALDTPHMFVDLAYEDVAERAQTGKPLVLLRRTSCNDRDIRSLQLEKGAQWFNWQTTADASSVRATPTAGSALRRGGIAYMQSYNVVKDMFASADRSTGPMFSEPGFGSLAYSQASLTEFANIDRSSGRSGSATTRSRALQAFKALVIRLHHTIADNRDSPTGFSTR